MHKSLLSKIFLLSLPALLCTAYAAAQEKVPEQVYAFQDTVQQTARSIPPEVIEGYRASDDFDYRQGYQQTVSIWQQIWQWILQQLGKIFGEFNVSFSIEWLLYIFCAAMIIFAILKLMGVNIAGLFNRQKQQPAIEMQSVEEENIHELNFEEEISKAQQASDYRRAVRLLYIYTLKKLTDAEHIDWHPGKTNADYQRELSSSKLAPDFRSLSIYYEYAWYGEFPVDVRLYEKVNQLHHSIDHQLSVGV